MAPPRTPVKPLRPSLFYIRGPRFLLHLRERMMKLRSRRLFKSSSSSSKNGGGAADGGAAGRGEIKWELRPGGMLVQKRDDGGGGGGEVITVRVSAGAQGHDVCIEATSTFGEPSPSSASAVGEDYEGLSFGGNGVSAGELKAVLSMVTGLEPAAQRLLYKGKEREDGDFLHMTGVKDMDKVLLLEDPAAKEMKLHALRKTTHPPIGSPLPTIKV